MTEKTAVEIAQEQLWKLYDTLNLRINGAPGLIGLEETVTDLRNTVSRNSENTANRFDRVMEYIDNRVLSYVERWRPKLDGNGVKSIFQRVEDVESWQREKDKEDAERRTDRKAIRIGVAMMVFSAFWNIFGDWISHNVLHIK